MQKLLATLLLGIAPAFIPTIAGATSTADFSQCRQLFVNSAPPKVAANPAMKLRPLCYDAFAVLHSGRSKTPVYVAERLSRAQLVDARDEKRTDQFFADARLPRAERAELDDYKGSGYDRGHLAPAGDQPTAQAMAQSFSLANMTPQAPKNNREAWNSIESATRKYVMRAKGDVYVISGPVFGDRPDTIGQGRVWVPEHYFKLVYDQTTNRAWAHWIANTNEAHPSKPISYRELTKRTGVEFLPGVSPVDEATPVTPEVGTQASSHRGGNSPVKREEDLAQLFKSSVQSAAQRIQKSMER
ncbi:DNA/RNA non-specific endonuclease [Cupriavidus pauculus]|uniref:Endonuclease n=1 Tax=Cupriavidus pauculus TaxID=82633 RepID=A0A2N5CB51_9BURK|nr:DNA/RNA non-specific endonuclease [Cupriavidus pauculus]PLP99447.1 DNA/RNA non-specific endonuclease [Cupriavidus pauculus]